MNVLKGLLLFFMIFPSCAFSQKNSFIGTHFHDVGKEPLAIDYSIGSIRLWDARVGWRSLEPEKGSWNFSRLDRAIDSSRSMGVEVVLPLGVTPTWASAKPSQDGAYGNGSAAPPYDIQDWEMYVKTVVTRYKGKVFAYEIWNEPNRTKFYSGSLQQLVDLTCSAYRIIKNVDPLAIVVSPAATDQFLGIAWLEQFLRTSAKSCFDVIGFHFYTQAHEPPEAIIPLIVSVKKLREKYLNDSFQIWNTEFGWYVLNSRVVNTIPYKKLHPDVARDYLIRSLILQRSYGVSRAFHYAWNNRFMGVIEPDTGELKSNSKAFYYSGKWISRDKDLSCQLFNGYVKCEVVSLFGSSSFIVWATDGNRMIRIDRNGQDYQVVSADGRVSAQGSDGLNINGTPLCYTFVTGDCD